jgi:flagellar biosynthesis GTPase FlhF
MIVDSSFFTNSGVHCFFGFPGSGTTSAMASIAASLRATGEQSPDLICCDDWTVGKSDQMRLYASILGVPFSRCSYTELMHPEMRGCFAYLRGFNKIEGFSLYDGLFGLRRVRKILAIDCSRNLSLNERLIDAFSPGRIDGVALTRMSMSPCIADTLAIIERSRLPVVFSADGDE